MSSNIKESIRALVNSANRLNPLTETSSNFTYSFNEDISRVTEIIINNVEIPFSFYTINSTNNVLIITVSGTQTITLTEGNYTATSLSAELQTQLEANGTIGALTPVVSFISNQLKFKIEMTSAFVVVSESDNALSTLSSFIGFQSSSASSISNISDSVINLAGTSYIRIVSEYLTDAINTKTMFADNSHQDTLIIVPANGSSGDIINLEPKTPLRLSHKITIKTSDVIDFQLLDQYGNELNLNGLDWSMQLIFNTL